METITNKEPAITLTEPITWDRCKQCNRIRWTTSTALRIYGLRCRCGSNQLRGWTGGRRSLTLRDRIDLARWYLWEHRVNGYWNPWRHPLGLLWGLYYGLRPFAEGGDK